MSIPLTFCAGGFVVDGHRKFSHSIIFTSGTSAFSYCKMIMPPITSTPPIICTTSRSWPNQKYAMTPPATSSSMLAMPIHAGSIRLSAPNTSENGITLPMIPTSRIKKRCFNVPGSGRNCPGWLHAEPEYACYYGTIGGGSKQRHIFPDLAAKQEIGDVSNYSK